LLYLSYVGISISKEINIAVMLWIILFYYFLCFRKFNLRRLILGVPLIAVFLFTLSKIIVASTQNFYGTKPITLDLIVSNSQWIYTDLLQLKTSPVIAAVFIVLTALLLINMFLKIIKGNVNGTLLYTLFLLGQFITLFMILSTSWAKVLRYWYPLIPLLSMLLAFSIDDVLKTAKKYHINHIITAAVVCFVIYFTGCNYYTFLLQTVAQHSTRNAEYNLIQEIKELERNGQYVYIMSKKNDPDAELVHHLIAYFRRFEPRFYGTHYQIYTTPPSDPGQTYFLVTKQREPVTMEIHRVIKSETNYRMLHIAFKISSMFRGSPPVYIKDAGVDVLSTYQWTIYKARA